MSRNIIFVVIFINITGRINCIIMMHFLQGTKQTFINYSDKFSPLRMLDGHVSL
jgi:hypothetical protein